MTPHMRTMKRKTMMLTLVRMSFTPFLVSVLGSPMSLSTKQRLTRAQSSSTSQMTKGAT